MNKTAVILTVCVLTLTGCATTVPVPVTCPPPPPVPETLKQPVSAGPSLSEQLQTLMQGFRSSLGKAMKPE